MAKQVVDVGSKANDGSGDSLRDAGIKINANFTEVYSVLGGTSGNLSVVSKLTGANGIVVSNPTGDITLTNRIATSTQLGVVKIGNNLTINSEGLLSANSTSYTLPTATTSVLGGVKVDGTTITITDGVISSTGGGTTYDQSLNTTDSVTFNEITSTYLWQNSSKTSSPNGVNVLGATPTVVFSTPNWFTSIKLVIAVEGRLDSDNTNVDHTQTCEATIAATYNTAAEPIMSVYGIVYTSPSPLATFTVARNGLTGQIEVTAVNSQTTNTLNVRVHTIQFVSRYD